MKCLLVDDEPGIREGLAALLRRKGHDVRTAADCAAARTFLATEVDFDVVVTDWHLPDGTAATFVAMARCPVVAVSGHPEEIEREPGIAAVLTKPVMPQNLLETLAAVTVEAAAAAAAMVPCEPPATSDLPADVQAAIAAFVAVVPPDAVTTVHDDGTFVTVRAHWAWSGTGPRTAAIGDLGVGDLRTWTRAGERHAELRLCRDGRPDPALPSVPAGADWPERAAFAVDFHGAAIDVAAFGLLLARRRAFRARGRVVHFLNVPDALAKFATSHGNAHDMPMRAAVGPRLQAEQQDLWSGS
ncbi:MAG: response regulator [Planctomycetes bacterium]|nr:response regulator [Planctomycetota bacterium]